jgi:Skp family chaperone for outer membrane proteins
MTTHILDFEEVLRNFEPYHVSLKSIQKEKKEFSELIDAIKVEMETILSGSKSLILDDATNQKNQMRFKELQNKAMQAESEFRSNIVARQNEEVEKNFQQIMDIVQEYSIENSLDLVVNKSTVVYVNPKLEITQQIIEVVKQKELYVEYIDGMYENENA